MAPVLVHAGARDALEELVALRRENLNALVGDAFDRVRGRLHLAIGLSLAVLEESLLDEAIEEVRQALAQLPEEETRLDHAEARYHLGRLLLDQAMLFLQHDRGSAARAPIQEAAHHLEQAHRLFAAERCAAAQVEATRRWSYALSAQGQYPGCYALLERERAAHEGELRRWIELCLAEHTLEDPDSARQAQGAEILAAYFEGADSAPQGMDDVVMGMVGLSNAHLPPALVARALAWLETRSGASRNLLISLRRRVYSGHPERWLTPREKAELVTTMDDSAASIAERAEAAHTMLSALPKREAPLQRRACELFEIWLESPEIHPLQKPSYRHDLAVAMRMSAQQDASWLERAARHLAIALEEMGTTADRATVASNLAHTLLAVLELRAKVSSPALLDLVARVEAITPELSPEEAREMRLTAASELMQARVLAHPECLEKAGALLGEVLTVGPEDVDAHRLRYLHAWLRYQQGALTADLVDRIYARARSLSQVSPLVAPDDTLRSIARSLAGNGSLEGADLGLVIGAIPVRPDAEALLLDELERRLALSGATAQERRKLLEQAILATTVSVPGNEDARGRWLATQILRCAPHLASGELAKLAKSVLSPAAKSMREALQAAGAALDEPVVEGAVGADLKQRTSRLHRRGVELMQKAQQCTMARDEEAARKLNLEAQQALDEAGALARRAAPETRAMIQISAGNARRRRAEVDEAHAPALLDEAEALYREAWPWTEGHTDLRAQLAKVLADTLIQRHRSGRWAEAMDLYRTALAGRPAGFKRWETLWAMIDAELLCSDRPRPASLLAAIARADEALEHVAPGEKEKKALSAKRMLHLLQMLAGQGQVGDGDVQRFAARIEAAAPELASDAWLAARGLGVTGATINPASSSAEIVELLSSDFVKTLTQALEISSPAITIESVPAHLRDQFRDAVERGKINLVERNLGDAQALHDAAKRLHQPALTESLEAGAGRLVGRARLLNSLEVLGDAAGRGRIAACVEAEAAVRAIERPAIRGVALAELAMAWQHHGKGGDFTRSTRLLDEALSLLPADWLRARADATSYRARSFRYRADMPARDALELAILAYQEAAALHQQNGEGFGVAGALKNLAEAVSARQDRPRAAALSEGLAIERRAIEIARRVHASFLGELLGNHAHGLTLLAQALEVAEKERAACLEEAGKLFEEAMRITTDPAIRRAIENNRLTWRSLVASEGTGNEHIAELRAHLRGLDQRFMQRDWAMAAHNLADELFEQGGIDNLREALDLFRQALPFRPIAAEPKFHWETAERLGELLAGLFKARRRINLTSFRLTANSARSQAVDHLRSALRAARSFGPGLFMTRTALALGQLAADVDIGDMPDLALTAESLAAIEEVLALAPEDQKAGEAEADVAAATAGALALQRAQTAPIQAVTTTGATALHGGAAWEVLHWMLQARGGQHRRLRARMTLPKGAPPEVWTRWRLALRGQHNWDERREAMQAVRAACPSFLSGEPALDATLAWMKETGGAAAMLLETSAAWLLGVLAPGDEGGSIQAWVVLLRVGPPTLTLPALLKKLRAPILPGAADDADAEARKTLDALVDQLRAHVLPDLRERIPERANPLLWSPHGVAAGVPLGMIWENLPSIWTTPCLTLPPPLLASVVPSSALLVLAAPTDAGALGGAEEGIGRMASALAAHLPRIEVLLGRGRAAGQAVAGELDVPGLVPNMAPSPAEVLRRLADHRLIVLLAHGHYNDGQPEKSAFDLIGPDGRASQLNAEALAERPDLLHRAVVILLSCETGAAGELSAAPAGLTGVLLAIGAAAVVAPLWPVYLEGALMVGERVARAVSRGIELGEAVQMAVELVRADLGEDVKREAPYGLVPFVVWTG